MSCFPCFSSHGKATKRAKSGRREQSVSLHSRSGKHQQQHQPPPQQHHHPAPAPAPPPRPTPPGSNNIYLIFSLYYSVNAKIGLEIEYLDWNRMEKASQPSPVCKNRVRSLNLNRDKKKMVETYLKPSSMVLGLIINLDFSFQKVTIYPFSFCYLNVEGRVIDL